VIIFYAKKPAGLPMLGLGLLPKNIERLKQGQPIFRRLGDDVPELRGWELFIGHNQSARDRGTRIITITFHDESINRFVVRQLWEIPAQPPDMPFNITLFYAENEEKLMAELVAGGVKIEHFIDKRGVAN